MRRGLLPVLTAAVLLLSGCTPAVSLQAAPDATAVGCARVIVGVRDVQAIGPAERRNTDAQGTAAWGSPVAVTLYCGVRTPTASTLRCYRVAGVDWLFGRSGSTRVLTTFGRQPGVQVITTQAVSANDALDSLGDAVRKGTRATGTACLGGPSASPGP